jgi:hypothetical protein
VTSVDAGVFIDPNLGGTALTIRELSSFQDQMGRIALLRRVIAYLVQNLATGAAVISRAEIPHCGEPLT